MRGAGEKPKLRLVTDASATASARCAGRVERGDLDALVAAFVSGDREVLHDLVAGNEALVLAIVRRYARTPQDASDLVYRTFLDAVGAAERVLRWDPERSVAFRRSLLRAALSASRTQLRREIQFAPARLELGPAGAPVAAGPGANPDEERGARVRGAVMRLPRRAREVFTLAVDAELRIAEIAEVLGITPHAARANLRKACLLLRGAPRTPKPPACCRELAPSLPVRAVGALERAESLRVDGHLAGCRACADEAASIAEVLAAAALAPPTDAERRALEDVPERVLVALRCGSVRERLLCAIAATAVVATLALALYAP